MDRIRLQTQFCEQACVFYSVHCQQPASVSMHRYLCAHTGAWVWERHVGLGYYLVRCELRHGELHVTVHVSLLLAAWLTRPAAETGRRDESDE
jgi:hypothetical protein